MNVFLAIPFFRIIIPFLSGILLAVNYSCPDVSSTIFIALLIPLILLQFLKRNDFFSKRLALLLMDLFLFVYGIELVNISDKSRQTLFYGNYLKLETPTNFIAFIDDLPLEKEKSIKCSMQLLEIKDDSVYRKVSGNLVLYFRKSISTKQLRAGDVLLVKTTLKQVPAPQNPLEFDYRAYLSNRQVFHTAFADSSAFSRLNTGTYLNPVWHLGLICKSYILTRLKQSTLSKNSYAICAALLTGYDDDIDKTVMEAFSHSGTLHVLSVSGLHTGLIYLVLAFIFDLFDRKKKLRLLKFIFITLVLWLFALITGFSSPVLRAVLMFNLLGFGKIYFRQDYRNQMNILLVSAFILLLYNPFFITDVGFQLSYFALAGLIYFQPGVSGLWKPSNYILNATWQSVAASVAATLSTLPLTLFYFKQFPIWFFVCNLVVVPATFVILLLGVLVVIQIGFAATLINYLIAFLILFIDLFNSAAYGFVDMISFTFLDALLLSGLIVLISVTFQYRSYKCALGSMVVLLCWQVTSLVISFQAKQTKIFTVYAVKNKTTCSVKNKLTTTLTRRDSSDYNFHIKPHLISFNNPEIKICPFNYLEHNKTTVLILDQPGAWPQIKLKPVKILVVANNFRITEADLQNFSQLELIVSAASNNTHSNKKTQELSRKFDIDFYDTRQSGAYLLAFD